jgi:hypothetical protein
VCCRHRILVGLRTNRHFRQRCATTQQLRQQSKAETQSAGQCAIAQGRNQLGRVRINCARQESISQQLRILPLMRGAFFGETQESLATPLPPLAGSRRPQAVPAKCISGKTLASPSAVQTRSCTACLGALVVFSYNPVHQVVVCGICKSCIILERRKWDLYCP